MCTFFVSNSRVDQGFTKQSFSFPLHQNLVEEVLKELISQASEARLILAQNFDIKRRMQVAYLTIKLLKKHQ
jgi:hypothetical protein